MNTDHEKVRAHIILSGRVQGVAFRYYAREVASRLGVKGWIKNLVSGEVEIVLEGKRKEVEKMIEWLSGGTTFSHGGKH
ncbi:MAG: Acylphosphatase [Parcubacteria bacterium 32_520]|nr:MAG: Acylphosphatase [Parcubacteria bacterium 32_520]